MCVMGRKQECTFVYGLLYGSAGPLGLNMGTRAQGTGAQGSHAQVRTALVRNYSTARR